MSEQSKTISREELYQQLWKVPISRLAVSLGYSYLELLKICADLRIPRPTGGYWYRLQHGGSSEGESQLYIFAFIGLFSVAPDYDE